MTNHDEELIKLFGIRRHAHPQPNLPQIQHIEADIKLEVTVILMGRTKLKRIDITRKLVKGEIILVMYILSSMIQVYFETSKNMN